MLEIENLTLHYGQSPILKGVSICAPRPGQVTCVMGTNGVGKTSLLKAISGVHHRSGGEYMLDGEALAKPPAHINSPGQGCGLCAAGPRHLPVADGDGESRDRLCLSAAVRARGSRIRSTSCFPVLKEMRNRRGGDLSGGQQQQLSIARALITKPKLLLLDEPTEGIQPNIIQQIGRVIAYAAGSGRHGDRACRTVFRIRLRARGPLLCA
jgi:urea transport system ATP-binding protein